MFLHFLWGPKPLVYVVLPYDNYQLYFFFILYISCFVNVNNFMCAPHPYVQAYADTAVEDHCLVLSLGDIAV